MMRAVKRMVEGKTVTQLMGSLKRAFMEGSQ